MVLVLSTQQIAEMSAHAERVYPEECCGLMLGNLTAHQSDQPLANNDKQRQKNLVELVPLNNEWTPETMADPPADSIAHTTSQGVEVNTTEAQTKHHRYWIDPKDMLKVQREAREKGLNIIGIYHSHPDHVAEPSECDRALAWSEYAYVIVSVCEGKAVDVRNWALDSKQQFQPEAMKAFPSNVHH